MQLEMLFVHSNLLYWSLFYWDYSFVTTGRNKRDVTIDPDEDEGYYMVFNEDEVKQNTVNENVSIWPQ